MQESRPKILVVDDEKGLRIGVQRLLEIEGFEVDTAENGTDGIKLGTEKEYDIAIIDLKMPDVEGIEVLKNIKQKFPNTVCFIATAFASYDTAIEATKLGAQSYIPKPFTPEELIAEIKNGYQKRLLLLEEAKWIKEREERLLEVAFEKTRLNTIINSITDGVLVVNKEGLAVLFNPAVYRFLELSEIKVEEYIPDKLRPEILELINKFLLSDSKEKRSYTIQLELKPNREFFIEATASPVFHPGDNLAGVVIVFKDITELKRIELIKSQFVSMVSHELKAPIAAVYGFLKLMSDENIQLTDEHKKEYINRSMVRLDGLLKMVNDLLDISQMELKTIRREIRKICLTEIIKNVLELFQIELRKANITVNFNYEKDSFCIDADADEITRLFTNIISNSIKYNRPSGSITININHIGNFVVTEITDTGIGMKEDEKKKLFSEFFRAKNEFTKNVSGTGLGLSIVKRIVDSYSGKIEVESEYGVGTTFRIYLPLSVN